MSTTALLACALFLSPGSLAPSQEVEPENAPYTSIVAIRTNPVKDRVARIEGQVVRLIQTPYRTENYYFLRDDSGRTIKISTTLQLPRNEELLVVEGIVDFVHSPDRELILREKERFVPPPKVIEQSGHEENPLFTSEDLSQQQTLEAVGAVDPLIFILVAAGITLLLLGAAAGAFLYIKSRKKPGEPELAAAVPGAHTVESEEMEVKKADEEGLFVEAEADTGESPLAEAEEEAAEASEEPPEDQDIEEEEPVVADDRDKIAGELVKVFYPLPGKELSLPGRMEIVGGENELRELYFRLPKDETHKVFTFGNKKSTDFGHFHINHDSVAENQAKLVYSGGQFELINYSLENATRVNSIELEDGGKIILDPGDLIEMGVLEMVFHTDTEEEDEASMSDLEATEDQAPAEKVAATEDEEATADQTVSEEPATEDAAVSEEKAATEDQAATEEPAVKKDETVKDDAQPADKPQQDDSDSEDEKDQKPPE